MGMPKGITPSAGTNSHRMDTHVMRIFQRPMFNRQMTESVVKSGHRVAWVTLGCQLIILSCLLLAGTTVSARMLAASDDPITKIEADYLAGAISLDQRAIFMATAIRKPESLPVKYAIVKSTDETVVLPGRGATLALLQIKKDWDKLQTSTQNAVAQVLTRWSTAFTFDTPSGFFKVHWDTIGVHAVPKADVSGNGIPDYVDKSVAYLDSTYTKNIALGYLLPPSDGAVGGDGRYDVYFENMPYYGYAQPEANGPAAWNDATSYLVLHNDFIGFPPNSDPEGDIFGAMKVTIGHEFHHSVQFGYDYTEYGWYMELDATHAEDVFFPLTHDNFNYLSSYFSVPALTLMDESGLHMYGSYIWGKYLEQKFDLSLSRAVWEGARFGATVFTTLSDTLMARYGWTQDSAFGDFAAWNYVTSTRNDGMHHTDAASYPLMPIGRTHNSYPVALQTGPNNPGGYAANYIQFFPGVATGTLHIAFDGSNSVSWGAYVIASTATNVHQFYQITLAPVTYAGSIDIPNFQSYQSLTLVSVNTGEFSGPTSFQYSAQISSVYNVAAKILTDTMIYSGATRQIQVQVKNAGPISDVVRLTGSDTQGWMSLSFIDQGLAGGDSSVVNIPVTPPQGTPLGTSTTLSFKATSRTDTSKHMTISQPQTVVLQIGDVDFDGTVDISDLTVLISYLYLSGPAPQPVLAAGDYDCQNPVDIADLTSLISFLYLSGPPCACRYF